MNFDVIVLLVIKRESSCAYTSSILLHVCKFMQTPLSPWQSHMINFISCVKISKKKYVCERKGGDHSHPDVQNRLQFASVLHNIMLYKSGSQTLVLVCLNIINLTIWHCYFHHCNKIWKKKKEKKNHNNGPSGYASASPGGPWTLL